jgi:hypothetical protein
LGLFTPTCLAWKATGGNIDPDGTFVTGDKNSNITVSAIVGTISDSASVTGVEPPKLTSLVVSTQQVEMKQNQLQCFTFRDKDYPTNDDALNLNDEADLSIISALDIQDIDAFWNDGYRLDTNYPLDGYSSDLKYVSYCRQLYC